MSIPPIPKGWRRVPTGGIKRMTDKYREATEDEKGRLHMRWRTYRSGYPEAAGTRVQETNYVIRRAAR